MITMELKADLVKWLFSVNLNMLFAYICILELTGSIYNNVSLQLALMYNVTQS